MFAWWIRGSLSGGCRWCERSFQKFISISLLRIPNGLHYSLDGAGQQG